MKKAYLNSIRSLFLAAALSTGLGFVTPVFAGNRFFIIDLNSGTGTDLGGSVSLASGINDAGQVVGGSYTATGFRAFITGPNGVGMTDIDTGKQYTYAAGINNAGQVVGVAFTGNGPEPAFITGPNGVGVTQIGTGWGVYGINNAGQLLEGSGDGPFLTGPNGVGMTIIDTPDYTAVTGLNDAGQVIGFFYTTGGAQHAFITGPNGVGMTDLGTLGELNSHALGVNNAGQVVGWVNTAAGPQHAFITGPDGQGMTDLSTLVSVPGLTLSRAVAINNVGQVLVFGSLIPEPETYALMLAGLGLIGVMARRRKPA